MSRLWQASHPVFFFLALLLHCSHVCLAASYAHAAVTAPVSTDHGPEHSPCHSSPAPAHGLPEKCLDCGDHLFLAPVPSGAEMLAAARALVLPLCPLLQPVLPVAPPEPASRLRRDNTALSPPRYLALSVLRL